MLLYFHLIENKAKLKNQKHRVGKRSKQNFNTNLSYYKPMLITACYLLHREGMCIDPLLSSTCYVERNACYLFLTIVLPKMSICSTNLNSPLILGI